MRRRAKDAINFMMDVLLKCKTRAFYTCVYLGPTLNLMTKNTNKGPATDQNKANPGNMTHPDMDTTAAADAKAAAVNAKNAAANAKAAAATAMKLAAHSEIPDDTAQLHFLPLQAPEIAFVGRSNAGKSTCINAYPAKAIGVCF